MHMLNHLIALNSPAAHLLFMGQLRTEYRLPVIETGLFPGVVIQVACD
jgi:hypothetical protein